MSRFRHWALVAATLIVTGCCELLPEFCCDSPGYVGAVFVEFRDERGCAYPEDIAWKLSFVDASSNIHIEEGDLRYHDSIQLGSFEMKDADEDCRADSLTILIDDGCHPGTHYNLTLINEVFSQDIVIVKIEADGHPTVTLDHPEPSAAAKLDELSGCDCLSKIADAPPKSRPGTKIAGSLSAAPPLAPIPDPDPPEPGRSERNRSR
ncbi:MAG TPA: hypothetical protein VM165_15675 [Planctomycetaceae bacterium]|nr:hypothetical protein [Planctomycetaceae bacterium]